MAYSRRASHAGSWYEGSATMLKATVDDLLEKAKDFQWAGGETLVGVISPHAGISYSGTTAAHAYKALCHYIYGPKGNNVSHIFLLGPDHHQGFEGVQISGAEQYETPFGAIPIDTSVASDVYQALKAAGVRTAHMSQLTDEEEHSIEMQLPFISHILHYPPAGATRAKDRIRLVPMVVGWTDREVEERMGAVLSSYARDPRNIFVLSSDFCHWGSRFQYKFHYQKTDYPAIADAIIAMDHEGMEWLEKRDMNGWYDYLNKTRNTICGRRPISVGIEAIKNEKATSVRFLHYSQSNRCSGPSDSSVSYASAVITHS
ncbi:protein MEMO1 [Trypanosoma conorhini]|uniref:Protein MEMO1 n=1 Tax=Trypanosoma conorhini TaxID=83891 RepID=A0A3R7L7U2_9TRYP|nr:protein MEMO1 [Trypanosoma conorhini]RNF17904.1 protein MEMO1 [Trypanosoma conorhini]